MASACTVLIIDISGLTYFTFMCIVWKHTQVISMSFLLKYGWAVGELGPQWIDHCSPLTLIIQAWLPQSAAVKWIGRGHMLLSSGGEAPRGCLIHICLIDTCPIQRGQVAVCVYVFAERPGQPGGINKLAKDDIWSKTAQFVVTHYIGMNT